MCYREASNEQYRQFCDDVATRSDMCETTRKDVNDVIRQLDEQTNRTPRATRSKVTSAVINLLISVICKLRKKIKAFNPPPYSSTNVAYKYKANIGTALGG